MAIKLADVIENVNSSYPLLDASVAATTGGSIKGFGIFKSTTERDAVPTNKRCYGYVAIVLYNDGVINEASVNSDTTVWTNVANLYDFNLSGTVAIADGAGLDDLEGSPVDISTNLFDITTGARMYIYKPPTGGLVFSTSGANAANTSNSSSNITASDLDEEADIGSEWTVATNWVEVPLAGVAHPQVTSADLATDQENFSFNVFDSGTDYKTKRLKADDFFGWLTQGILYALAELGIGTVQNYTNPTTGVVGDLNGDGQVTTSDLLILLSNFETSGLGTNPDAAVTDTVYANNGSTIGNWALFIGTFEPEFSWGYGNWQDWLDDGYNYSPAVISAAQNSPGGTAGSFNVSFVAGQTDQSVSGANAVASKISFTKNTTGMSANLMRLNLVSMATQDSAYSVINPNFEEGQVLIVVAIIKLFDSNDDQVGLTRGHPFVADLSNDDGIPGVVVYQSTLTGTTTTDPINLIDFGVPEHTAELYNGVPTADAPSVEKIEVSFYHAVTAANQMGVVAAGIQFDLRFETFD